MKNSSESIKADMLDYGPNFKSSGPDKIMAASGILTMKNKDFIKTLNSIDDKFLKGFHNEATRRGHASLTTSINYYFWIEGSRIVDFYFSSFPFGSYLIFSSRRIKINPENLIIPDSISESVFKDEYERLSTKMVELYHTVNEQTGRMDYARRILPIGFVSKLFLAMPLQTMVGVVKEVKEDQKKKEPLIPKEIHEIAGIFEKTILENTPHLSGASFKLSYNTNFPHPNLFNSDLKFVEPRTEILIKRDGIGSLVSNIKDNLDNLPDDPKVRVSKTASVWKNFVENVHDKLLVEADVRGTLSIWNDIKRHRTIRQNVESIYSAVQRSLDIWDNDNFYIPQLENSGIMEEIIRVYKDAFDLYKRMVDSGIEKRDAIFIIPHGVKLGIRMLLDGYHFFDPFGFVGIRSCTTTDHEIVSMVNKIATDVKNKVPEIGDMIGPKCKVGYCPEKVFCNVVKKFVKDYDQKKHSDYYSVNSS